jgi:hypothetical protein
MFIKMRGNAQQQQRLINRRVPPNDDRLLWLAVGVIVCLLLACSCLCRLKPRSLDLPASSLYRANNLPSTRQKDAWGGRQGRPFQVHEYVHPVHAKGKREGWLDT